MRTAPESLFHRSSASVLALALVAIAGCRGAPTAVDGASRDDATAAPDTATLDVALDRAAPDAGALDASDAQAAVDARSDVATPPDVAAHDAAADAAAPHGPFAGHTLSGVVPGAGTVGYPATPPYGTWRNRPVEIITDYGYPSIGAAASLGNTAVRIDQYRGAVTAGIPIVWSTSLVPAVTGATLAGVAAGTYDNRFADFADALIAAGMGASVIRLGWECNGDWGFAWQWSGHAGGVSGTRPANTAASYVAAFAHAVTVMRGRAGAHFVFDWNFSPSWDPSTGVNANPFSAYPGDAYVDVISMDVYDEKSSTSETPAQSWTRLVNHAWGLDATAAFAATHGKRLAFPEWGLAIRADGYGNGDDSTFVSSLAAWIAAHDVAYETYFNANDSATQRFAIATGTTTLVDSPDFPLSAPRYRSLFGR